MKTDGSNTVADGRSWSDSTAGEPGAASGNATADTAWFQNSTEHVLAELARVDWLLRGLVTHGRELRPQEDPFRGLYISESDADAMLQNRPAGPAWWTAPSVAGSIRDGLEKVAHENARRRERSLERGIDLRLVRLQRRFELTPEDLEIALLCLGAELDSRYERLYGYLQDDVTKKRPSVDLLLNLLSVAGFHRLETRKRFASASRLLEHSLIELIDDPALPDSALVARFAKLDRRIAEFLLDSDELDERVRPYVRLEAAHAGEPEEAVGLVALATSLARLLRHSEPGERLVHLAGRRGAAQEAFARHVAAQLERDLLVVDCERLCAVDAAQLERLCRLVRREGRLRGAAVFWRRFDSLLEERKQSAWYAIRDSVKRGSGVEFIESERSWEHSAGPILLRMEWAAPSFEERAQVWAATLRSCSIEVGNSVSPELLAGRFRLSAPEILSALRAAEDLARLRADPPPPLVMDDLYEACRAASTSRLGTLARRVPLKYGWNDIVLPDDRRQQLLEICSWMKQRQLVYSRWGFEQRLVRGVGLSVLFAGPSGTGKTMAAQIIAADLELELYKIDLASVVSKYIGETEKNLSRIFDEAESANAILFFDEADALFGKRSEVRDSHDRYANVEIAYLLQRMEEYDGIAILATNLRKNMDDAFVRRLQFVVDLPFPSSSERLRIWRSVWPEAAPLQPALDLAFLAEQFAFSGGNIRNIALTAAFDAAAAQAPIGMAHLAHGIRREYQKMGKVIGHGDFELLEALVTGSEVRRSPHALAPALRGRRAAEASPATGTQTERT